jgi:hypothetical protein
MKATPQRENRPSEFALVAPLLPFLIAPFVSVQLESRLPSPSLRALAVALVVLVLALVIVLVLRALELRPVPPRKLGPAALAVALGALATVGAFASSLLM